MPTGIATDATTAPFFRDLIRNVELDSLLDFVTNPDFCRDRPWSDAVLVAYRYRKLDHGRACQNSPRLSSTRYSRLPPRGQRIHVPASDLLLVNPNTGTCPMFRTRGTLRSRSASTSASPCSGAKDPEENPWGLSFLRMFNMATDSGLFRTREQLEDDGWTLTGNVFIRDGDRMLPLYEARLIHHFDHRFASYDKRPDGGPG